MNPSEPLFPGLQEAEAYARELPTRRLGRVLEYYRTVDSTNDLLAEAARKGAPHGLVVAAEEQLAGRGRFGRRWVAPFGRALLLSALARESAEFSLPFGNMGWLALGTAWAAAEAVRECSSVPARVKWPNDIVVAGAGEAAGGEAGPEKPPPWRKLGGVLCERLAVAGPECAVVAGLGLNVLQTGDELPELPKTPATSILLECGQRASRRALLTALLTRLEKCWEAFSDGEALAAFQARLSGEMTGWWRGWRFTVRTCWGTVAGRFLGLDRQARLCLEEIPSGERLVLADGEVLDGCPEEPPIA